MSQTILHHPENIPHKASLFVPNRMSVAGLKHLHRAFEGRLCILLASDFSPARPLISAIKSLGLKVETFDFRQANPRELRERLLVILSQGDHILFVPGEIEGSRGALCDIPAPFLINLGSLHISPVPIFCGHYSQQLHQVYATAPEKGIDSVEHISILPQLHPGPHAGERVMEAWMSCGADLFAEQEVLHGSLTTALVHSMRRHGKQEIIDGMSGTRLPYFKALGVAMTVAPLLKAQGHHRVGIILPPGPGAIISTLACLLAGITPAMINYASSKDAFESTSALAGCTHYITAQRFIDKLPQFPWPPSEQLIIVEDLLAGLDKTKLIGNVLMAKLAPASMICRRFDTDQYKGDDEAILLFTSGSSDQPKGLALTHKMLLANAAQCASRLVLDDTRFLASLPVFHSFGLMVTMLLPLLAGRLICSYPSPTEAKKLCQLTLEHGLNILCATPTFARTMLRQAQPGNFDRVRYFIVGAEKLQAELRNEFISRFGIELMEGYGLTEASPVCSVNIPDPENKGNNPYFQPSCKHGSIGVPLPGIAVRLTDLDDDHLPAPLSQRGMIWIKGANIFRGYIGKPELNASIFQDGWFKTGDIGNMDLNGFIVLGGRLSRFSKIGGEMVPHEGVEKLLVDILELDATSSELQLAVTSVADPVKGEALVLLSTLPEHQTQAGERASLASIREAVAAHHSPNIWIPKHLIAVEAIPVLPTGKLDLRGCRELAHEALQMDGGAL